MIGRQPYPSDRPSFFANRFVRLLTKSAAANEITPETCWLLTVIVQQEDAKRYRSAVTFWNPQLMSVCGLRSNERLNNARRRAVDNGWLHYEPGAKSRAGRYWVLVPAEYRDIVDGPCDEASTVCDSVSEVITEPSPNVETPIQVGNRKANPNRKDDSFRNPDRKADSKPASFNPKPLSGRNPDSDQMNRTFESALPLAVRACKALNPQAWNDRKLIARAATLAVSSLSVHWFEVSLGGVTQTTTNKRCAKFHTCCRDHAQRQHEADFDELAKVVNIPKTFYKRLTTAMRTPTPQVTLKRSPTTLASDAAMNAARNKIADDLRRIG